MIISHVANKSWLIHVNCSKLIHRAPLIQSDWDIFSGTMLHNVADFFFCLELRKWNKTADRSKPGFIAEKLLVRPHTISILGDLGELTTRELVRFQTSEHTHTPRWRINALMFLTSRIFPFQTVSLEMTQFPKIVPAQLFKEAHWNIERLLFIQSYFLTWLSAAQTVDAELLAEGVCCTMARKNLANIIKERERVVNACFCC